MTHPREEEFAFVRAILDDFDNPTPRLVFADWLEERDKSVYCERCKGQGEIITSHRADCNHCDGTGRVGNGFKARAEFIRSGLSGPYDIRFNRMRDILYRDHSIWDYNHPSFCLGMLDEVTLSPQQYHCHAALLCRLHPIRKLHIAFGEETGILIRYDPYDRVFKGNFGKIDFFIPGKWMVYNRLNQHVDYVREHALQWAREILQP